MMVTLAKEFRELSKNEGMTHPVSENKMDRKYPFVDMKISDNSFLNQVTGRSACTKCNKSRKFFCYTCCIPVAELQEKLPVVRLPVKIDIIKHKSEIDGKSSAVHAPILAPDDVRIFTYPDIPNYAAEERVVLIFPSANSTTVNQLFNDNIQLENTGSSEYPKGHRMGTLLKFRLLETNTRGAGEEINEPKGRYGTNDLPVLRAVFIDSTWNQSRGIYKDERINSLKSIALQNRISQFWRHQRGSPRWYLATIEAIHQFLLEVHVNAWGLNRSYKGLDNLEICSAFYETARVLDWDRCDEDPTSPYNGQYDNLLFFFSHMYDLIHFYYDHNELKSYKRPI